MDAETLALIGRNRLVNELLEAGIEVALPMRDKGIDLFAYLDTKETTVVAPIRLRASSGRSFAIDQKLEKVPRLIHAFVWGVGTDKPTTYALTHKEALGVADAMGYTITQAWQRGLYATQQPSKNLVEQLERFQMTPDAWVKKLGAVRDGDRELVEM